MSLISVIIVNFNTAELIKLCIDSVLIHTQEIDFEIIVVDNHSAERGIEQIEKLSPAIKFIQLNKNIGFGGACNKAVAIASGDYFLFLNPDTQISNNALQLFYQFWEENKPLNPACLGAQLTGENGEPTHSAGKFPDRTNYLKAKSRSLFHRFTGKRMNGKHIQLSFKERYRKVDYVTGAALFISRANFHQMNGFDQDFFMYFEETDLQWRLAKAGFNAYLINGPQIIHRQGGSLRNQQAKMRVLYFDSLLLYFKKHSSPFHFKVFRFCWFLLDLPTLMQKLFCPGKNK